MFQLFRIPTLRNTFWSAAGNALMAATSFVASIFVIRNLGPSEFGIFQEMIAYFTVFQTCESVINPNLYKRELLRPENDPSELVGAFGLLISALGLIASFMTAILIIVGILKSEYWILAVMLLGIIFRLSNGIAFYFDAHLKSLKGQISLNVGNGFSCIYKVWMSFSIPTAFLQAWAIPIQYFLTGIVHFVQFKKEIAWKIPSKKTWKKFSELAQESLPLFLSSFLEMMKTRLPFIFLGLIALPKDIGIYGAGVKLVEPWIFLASALSVSFWPKLIHGKFKGPEVHLKMIKIFFAVNFYVFLPLGVFSLLFGEMLITKLLGQIYVKSISIFHVHAVNLLVVSVTQALNLIELSYENRKIILYRNLLSLVFIFLSIWPCFQILGTLGAAYSVLLANILSLFVAPLFFKNSPLGLKEYLSMLIDGPRIILQELRERKKP